MRNAYILLSLVAGDRHGYGIIQDIDARGETTVPDVGTIWIPSRGSP
jgi:DNA-binding PadR family transcriptional regulator